MYHKSGLAYDILNAPYGFTTPHKLYNSAKGSLSFVQKLRLQRKLPVHNGCVNSICWNARGDYLLSGSDDQHLCITHGYNYNIAASVQTGHRANIFSAKFLPNTADYQVISCSGDGIIIYSDLTKPETSLSNVFSCHFGTAYEIMTVPNDSHTFLSCGEDGTVRWFDLRIKNSCSKQDCKEDILINCRCAVTTLAVNPLTPYHLGVGCSDSSVRIFDRRMLGTRATGSYTGSGIQAMVSRFTVPDFDGRSHRITSLSYSPDGSEMLVSYSSDYIYLFDVRDDNHANTKVLRKSEKPECSSSKSPEGRCKNSSERPLMKRLRVRGDWSDTGPNARPESEGTPVGEQRSRSLHASLLQRMSDVLTRMFNSPGGAQGTNRSSSRPEEAESTSSSSSSDQEETPQHPAQGAALDAGQLPYHAGASAQSESIPEESVAAGSSLQGLTQELTSQSKNQKMEPVFNLTFSGQGVQSGVISMADDQVPLASTSLPGTTQPLLRSETEAEDPIFPEVNPSLGATASGGQPVISLDEDETQEVEGAMAAEAQAAGGSGSLMMDVETWNLDNTSDEEEDEHPGTSSQQRAGQGRESRSKASILDSIDRELKIQREKREWEKTQMMNIPVPKVKKTYMGHRNARTMIKEATFWGSEFVMSGSDCGHIFVWEKTTACLVMILEADHHVVNCLQPHPFDPILASSGIDYDIKLWAPLKETPFFDEERAREIIQRNEVMLEETKDTITVPASFMIRMLASLNHLRSAGGWRRVARSARSDASESH